MIIVVGVLGVLLAVFQAVYLVMTRFAVSAQLQESRTSPKPSNPLGRVLLAFRGDGKRIENAELAELRISEAVLREVPRLERFQSFLRLAVAAGPLLGLIGTVIGMIITFRAIVASGTSDPRLMADGIGQAMIATVLGLGIAIPLLFINAGLASLSRGVTQTLDEQSQALLAQNAQRNDALKSLGGGVAPATPPRSRSPRFGSLAPSPRARVPRTQACAGAPMIAGFAPEGGRLRSVGDSLADLDGSSGSIS